MKQVNKLHWAVCIFAIIVFLFLFYGSAFAVRQELIDKYNQGVQYYESADYVEAAKIFKDLEGWGNCVEIPADDYYNMAIEHLKEHDEDIVICPECGYAIETKG